MVKLVIQQLPVEFPAMLSITQDLISFVGTDTYSLLVQQSFNYN